MMLLEALIFMRSRVLLPLNLFLLLGPEYSLTSKKKKPTTFADEFQNISEVMLHPGLTDWCHLYPKLQQSAAISVHKCQWHKRLCDCTKTMLDCMSPKAFHLKKYAYFSSWHLSPFAMTVIIWDKLSSPTLEDTFHQRRLEGIEAISIYWLVFGNDSFCTDHSSFPRAYQRLPLKSCVLIIGVLEIWHMGQPGAWTLSMKLILKAYYRGEDLLIFIPMQIKLLRTWIVISPELL